MHVFSLPNFDMKWDAYLFFLEVLWEGRPEGLPLDFLMVVEAVCPKLPHGLWMQMSKCMRASAYVCEPCTQIHDQAEAPHGSGLGVAASCVFLMQMQLGLERTTDVPLLQVLARTSRACCEYQVGLSGCNQLWAFRRQIAMALPCFQLGCACHVSPAHCRCQNRFFKNAQILSHDSCMFG